MLSSSMEVLHYGKCVRNLTKMKKTNDDVGHRFGNFDGQLFFIVVFVVVVAVLVLFRCNTNKSKIDLSPFVRDEWVDECSGLKCTLGLDMG